MTDPTSLPSFPPAADEHPLRDRIVAALEEDGFRPEIDPDGDVSFKVEGQQLFVHCTEGELPVMRVFGQWQIGPDLPQDQLAWYKAANDLSLRLNVAKVGINNGTLVVTCEHIIRPETTVMPYVQLSYQLVLSGVQMWHQLMLGEDVFGDGSGLSAGFSAN